jgi:hypothetical protein
MQSIAPGDRQQGEAVMIHHRITPTIALTLALTAITAAPASASSLRGLPAVAAPGSGSAQHASATPCGDICSSYRSVNVPTRTLANTVACGDVCSSYRSVNVPTPPSASATPCGDVCSGHGYGPLSIWTRTIPSVRPFAAAAPSGGFNWGDAGIGAGVAFALTMIGVGGVLATTNRRGRRAQQRQVSTSS